MSGRRRDHVGGRHRGDRLERQHVAGDDQADDLAGDERHPALGVVDAEGRAPTGPMHQPEEAVADQPLPSGRDAADHAEQRRAGSPGRPRPTRNMRSSRSPRRPRPRPPPGTSPRAGRPASPGPPGTGRPWCRSSGAPAPRRRRRRPRPRGSSYPGSPSPRTTPRRGRGSRPGCPVPPGGGPRRAGRGHRCRAPRKWARANSSDSRRSRLALRAVGALAGVDLEHDVAGEAGPRQVAEERPRRR